MSAAKHESELRRIRAALSPASLQVSMERPTRAPVLWLGITPEVLGAGDLVINAKAAGSTSLAQWVFDADEPTVGQWRGFLAALGDTWSARFQQLGVGVTGVGVDDMLAFALWCVRCANVDLRSSARWEAMVEAVHRWKQADLIGPLAGWWPALSTALTHQIATEDAQRAKAQGELIDAWVAGLGLLFEVAESEQPMDGLTASVGSRTAQALRAMRIEEERYRQARLRGETWHLLLDYGEERLHALPATAFIIEEVPPSGLINKFARHPDYNEGVPVDLTAIYRPGQRWAGTGAIVFSVRSDSGFTLRRLWQALEAAEDQRWEGKRPRGPGGRRIKSYEHHPEPPEQPWWDCHGLYELLGAPRTLLDGTLGSKLSWEDTLGLLWQCYQPLRQQRFLGPGSDEPKALDAHEPERLEGEHRLLALRFDGDRDPTGVLELNDTVIRMLAARLSGPVTVGVHAPGLPQLSTLESLPLPGGHCVVSSAGVVLLDDWSGHALDLAGLSREARDASRQCAQLAEIRREVRECSAALAPGELRAARQRAMQPRQRQQLARRVARLRAALIRLEGERASASTHPDHRSLRAVLDLRWGLQGQITHLLTEVKDIDDALRLQTALANERLTQMLALVSTPVFIGLVLGEEMMEALYQVQDNGHQDLSALSYYLGFLSNAALWSLAVLAPLLLYYFWQRGRD